MKDSGCCVHLDRLRCPQRGSYVSAVNSDRVVHLRPQIRRRAFGFSRIVLSTLSGTSPGLRQENKKGTLSQLGSSPSQKYPHVAMMQTAMATLRPHHGSSCGACRWSKSRQFTRVKLGSIVVCRDVRFGSKAESCGATISNRSPRRARTNSSRTWLRLSDCR